MAYERWRPAESESVATKARLSVQSKLNLANEALTAYRLETQSMNNP